MKATALEKLENLILSKVQHLTIRKRLQLSGGSISLLLAVVLVIALLSFASLSSGFGDILKLSSNGVEQANTTQQTIADANLRLDKLSSEIAKLGSGIQHTNQNIQILERKFVGFAQAQMDIITELEDIAGEMDDGDALYVVEDVTDTISDLEESIRREGLVSLAQTVKQMSAFTKALNSEAEETVKLSQYLNEAKALSEQMLAASSQINNQSNSFGSSIALARNLMIVVLLLILAVVFLSVKLLSRSITEPLDDAIGVANKIADGDLSNDIDTSLADETGDLLRAMDAMQNQLNKVIEVDIQQLVQDANVGNLNNRIELSDKKGCFATLSQGVNQLVDVSEQVVTDTSAMFAALERGNLTKRITTQYQGSFDKLKTDANNTAIKLTKAIEGDIQSIIDSARSGDLSQRIDSQGQTGFFRSLGDGINQVVEAADNIVKDTSRVLSALSNGDLTQQINGQYQGDFDQLKQDANNTVAKLKMVIEQDVQQMIDLAKQGQLDRRISEESKAGFYKTLCASINELLTVNEAIINDNTRVLGALANGDLSQRIEANYQGSFDQLKQDLNATIVKLTQVIQGDVQALVDAARQGDLNQRITTNDKKGFFIDLSNGINELVDISQNIVSDTGRILSALSSGDLSQQITANYHGIFDQLKHDANNTVDKLKTVIEGDIQIMVNQARQGNLSNRIDMSDKAGFYSDLGAGINALVDNSERIISDTSQVVSAMAHGDLSQTITSQYEGSFDLLKQDVNATILKLKTVIEDDIHALVDSANQGDLSQRIDLSDKEGFFGGLSKSINDLVAVNEAAINDTVRVMGEVTKGNLTQKVTGDYQGIFAQLQTHINDTLDNLSNVVTTIRTSATSVDSGSSEVAAGSSDLSARTQQQAAALEQTAASMKELKDIVSQTVQVAQDSTQMATDAKEVAEQGGDVVTRAIDAMSAINESSKQITDIIGVIDEIAFQTNLLALNASVEAARAGDSGRGFAVVAGEVRNLAQRSAGAAKQIKTLILESGGKVEQGTELVNQTGQSLTDIVDAVNQVTEAVNGISLDARQQYQSIEQINSAINSIDDMTQQNSALVEESSAASENMSEQAREMMSKVSFFVTDKVNQASTFDYGNDNDDFDFALPDKSNVAKLPSF